MIASEYDVELDELRKLSNNADQFLIDLETRERESSGISTLKVGYNRVHGYYIEISKGQADKAPVHYTRRQTLTNAERYITEELKAFEDKVLSARDRALVREKLLYEQLLDTVGAQLEPLKRCAAALSELDVLVCFAERAQTLDWVRPELSTHHACILRVAVTRLWKRCVNSDSSRMTLIFTLSAACWLSPAPIWEASRPTCARMP